MPLIVIFVLTFLFSLLLYTGITTFIGKKNIPEHLPKMKDQWIKLAKDFNISTNFETENLKSFKKGLQPVIFGKINGFVIEVILDKTDFISPSIIYCNIEINSSDVTAP